MRQIRTRTSRGARGRGFSLIEATVAMVFVGVMLVASLETLGSAARVRQSQVQRQRANSIAQGLLAEIVQAAYVDPDGGDNEIGLDTGETLGDRLGYDDVDDYDLLTEAPPLAPDGTELEGYKGWERSVKVMVTDPVSLVQLSTTIDTTGLKLIVVTVTDPRGATTSVAAMRSRAGAAEQHALGSTHLSQAELQLQIGAGSSALGASIPLVNQPRSLGSDLLPNGDMESGPAGWSTLSTCSLVSATVNPHAGQMSLEVQSRDGHRAGPFSRMTPYIVNGGSYHCEAWVRSLGEDMRFRLEVYMSTTEGSQFVRSHVGVVGPEWTRVEATLTPAWGGGLYDAWFSIDTEAGTDPFDIDDVRVRELQ